MAQNGEAMYNEERKLTYVEAATSLAQTADPKRYAVQLKEIFVLSEMFETKLGKDLCDFTPSEISQFLSEHFGGKRSHINRNLTKIKAYCTFCVNKGYSAQAVNQAGLVDSYEVDLSAGFKRRMVRDEDELWKVMEEAFDPESDETMSLFYRGYFLLLFAGLTPTEAINLKKADVYYEKGKASIITKGKEKSVTFSQRATKLLRKIRDLQQVSKRLNGVNVVALTPSDYVLTATAASKIAVADRNKLLVLYKNRIAAKFGPKKNKDGTKSITPPPSKKLSASSVFDSGVFYRVWMTEKRTGKLDFEEYVAAHIRSETAPTHLLPKNAESEYVIWKQACLLE